MVVEVKVCQIRNPKNLFFDTSSGGGDIFSCFLMDWRRRKGRGGGLV
jgi:hypothetical protein